MIHSGGKAGLSDQVERSQNPPDGATGQHWDYSEPGGWSGFCIAPSWKLDLHCLCQGPIEIARVFLQELFEGKVPSKHENKLRLCFKVKLKGWWILIFPTSRLPPRWAILRWGILISRYINIAHPGYNTIFLSCMPLSRIQNSPNSIFDLVFHLYRQKWLVVVLKSSSKHWIHLFNTICTFWQQKSLTSQSLRHLAVKFLEVSR